jgi:nucleoside-diphosphate-sugar epimerase
MPTLDAPTLAQAKAAGVPRFVYVGVASAVPAALNGAVLPGYFRGKAAAEAAVLAAYPAPASAIIKPSFIYGGAAFALLPPRVPAGYGGFVADVLGSGPARGLAAAAPGIVGVVLTPPVAVEAVALACAAAALGRVSGVIDGTDAIRAAAAAAANA